jgi:NAD(P)-dependent dehydrogenase (short-subunit alcohol dehydrogenase family)
MRFDSQARRVLITGETSGIGFAIPKAFTDAGAAVAATGLREELSVAAAGLLGRRLGGALLLGSIADSQIFQQVQNFFLSQRVEQPHRHR